MDSLKTETVSVRPLAPQDRAEWGRLWRAYLAFYETELPAARYDLQFARLMRNEPREVRGFLAAIGGRPVGLVHYIMHCHGWHAADICYLQDLYVDPDARGRGLGRVLIEAVYAQADAEGAAGVYWTTQHFNTEARKLYDRIGRLTPFIKYERA